jgi:hypothetical protein
MDGGSLFLGKERKARINVPIQAFDIATLCPAIVQDLSGGEGALLTIIVVG